MLVIKYSLTPDDHYKFNYYRFWKSPSQKKVRIRFYVRWIFYMVLIFIAIHWLRQRPPTNQDLLVAVVLILIGGLSIPIVHSYSLKRQIDKLLADEKNANYLAQTELTISYNGVYTKDDYEKSKYPWSTFVKKEESEFYYYLFLDSVRAITIPKRVFISQEERQEFELYLSKFFPVKAEFESLKQVNKIN
jgi:hypothetical protein